MTQPTDNGGWNRQEIHVLSMLRQHNDQLVELHRRMRDAEKKLAVIGVKAAIYGSVAGTILGSVLAGMAAYLASNV